MHELSIFLNNLKLTYPFKVCIVQLLRLFDIHFFGMLRDYSAVGWITWPFCWQKFKKQIQLEKMKRKNLIFCNADIIRKEQEKSALINC